MSDQVRIKAVPGRLVHDPDNRNEILPPEGKVVSAHDAYWFNRERQGDVTREPVADDGEAPAPAPAPARKATGKEE